MVIYSDQDVVIVSKPAGTAVQGGTEPGKSLYESLSREYKKLFIVHRIDTPVSGIVVFARTKKSAADLSRQFAERTVVKKYIAAAAGELPDESGTLTDNIHIPSGKKANKVYIRSEAGKGTKTAELSYRRIFRTDRYHIYEISLQTGRKHQIRVQLASRGAVIKGDIKYGSKRTNRGGGISLHALSLEFSHPRSGKKCFFSAPLPDDPIWNAVPASVLSVSDKPEIPEQ